MQVKRTKRTRMRAAKHTAGHGHKKKNRGAGNRGGRGNSNAGKRVSAKLMKVTHGEKLNLGKHGFTSRFKKLTAINIMDLQDRILTLHDKGLVTKEHDTYVIDLKELGFDKLLSKGTVNQKLIISVDAATEAAISKVNAAGGQVKTK